MKKQSGFTLIELSIVLVIIGLIVGGVLVGRDLISAAAVRSQIAQIEKYQTAMNTFKGKFGELPGDITAAAVARFGFTATPVRAGTAGRGDGNGEMNGVAGANVAYAWAESGENWFFWEDLSANSGLIEGNFSSAVDDGGNSACSSFTNCSLYMPAAKIGNGNFIYTYSGYANGCCAAFTGIGPNFFGLSVITSIGGSNVSSGGTGAPKPGLTVQQAYSMDKKMDDGIPTAGNILAQHLGSGGSPNWATNASSASTSTCFDTSSNTYSISQNNGNGVNCVLSFKFQ